MQDLQPKTANFASIVSSTINCKNGILSAAGNVTPLLVAIFASKTFAVRKYLDRYLSKICVTTKRFQRRSKKKHAADITAKTVREPSKL